MWLCGCDSDITRDLHTTPTLSQMLPRPVEPTAADTSSTFQDTFFPHFLSELLLPYSSIVPSSSLLPFPPSSFPPPLITTQYTPQHGSTAASLNPRCTRLHSLVSRPSFLSFSRRKQQPWSDFFFSILLRLSLLQQRTRETYTTWHSGSKTLDKPSPRHSPSPDLLAQTRLGSSIGQMGGMGGRTRP